MWSLTDGREISRVTRDEDVLSFAWSQDRRLLAISHLSGSVCLVDAVNGFRTLAETTLSDVCGMITFSPDFRFLFCGSCVSSGLKFESNGVEQQMSYCLSVDMQHGHFSLDRNSGLVSSELFEPELHSLGGFLLGDPICLYNDDTPGDFRLTYKSSADFVLNKQFVLKNYAQDGVVEMLYRDEVMKSERGLCLWKRVLNPSYVDALTFSVNGDTVYVLWVEYMYGLRQLMAWEVSSGTLKAEKGFGINIDFNSPSNLLAFRGGILLTRNKSLELWNFELTWPIHRWDDVSGILHPISDNLVACFGPSEVSILNTVTGDKMPTFKPPTGRVIACNSKCQLLTVDNSQRSVVALWQSQTVRLWEERCHLSVSRPFLFCSALPGIFSPMDDFILILFDSAPCEPGLYVLDAISGKVLHKLCKAPGCFKFVSNEECCVICPNCDRFGVSRLGLFNVRSGDLLSVLDIDAGFYFIPLATCPGKGLIAIGSEFFKFRFKIIKVKLPGEKNTAEGEKG